MIIYDQWYFLLHSIIASPEILDHDQALRLSPITRTCPRTIFISDHAFSKCAYTMHCIPCGIFYLASFVPDVAKIVFINSFKLFF